MDLLKNIDSSAEKSHMTGRCLNCGHSLALAYCANCGQKDKENGDRSIKRLMGELLTNMFFFDGRLWVSIRYLMFRPGTMSREYLDGKRRKYLSPISIFLFVNLLYFFSSPLTDYSLPLHDQMHRQIHSRMAKLMVEERIEERQTTLKAYTETYNAASLNLSKSIMVANVPLLALCLWPLFYKRRKFYYDALIFSLHFFTLFLLILVLFHTVHQSLLTAGLEVNELFMLIVSVMVLPLVMAVISVRNFVGYRWLFATLGGVILFLGIAFAQFIYRAVIFFLTFLIT